MRRATPSDRLQGLHDPDRGLHRDEARDRLAQYGSNSIIPPLRSGWRTTLIDTIKDPMLWFLLACGSLFALVGQYNEAVILLLALIPLLGMDAFLHRRTQASVAGLSGSLQSLARVVRDGAEQTIGSDELVPGDLVAVRAGESFPADGLIVAGEGIQVEESALTGESWPVRKQALAGPLTGSPGELHWGLAGTRVLTGQLRMRVAWTGAETLYGEIVRSARAGSHARTPLQRAVMQLVRVLVVAAGLFCLILAWLRYAQGHGWLDALLSALTLAVAAIPEEFPVVLTFFLGIGVYRLAKRRALVRRAVVVENIGRVSCICTDKTGTLTEGRLVLSHLSPAAGLSEDELRSLAAAAAQTDSDDPLDAALRGQHVGPAPGELIASFPYTEDRRRSSMVRKDDAGGLIALKGAPEVVLDLCDLDRDQRSVWLAELEAYSNSGHKVIACAHARIDPSDWDGNEPDQGLALAGLLAFEDPIRPGVAEAMSACRQAGIRVIMVTGDHPGTARAVGRELGLGGGQPCVIDGQSLAERLASDSGLANEVDIIARALPAHKLALVQALQDAGEIVAVTGDGINDVPALQAADVGIAMGERGTRSAREVASIVLLDDNFGSMVGAIAEGRRLFANLQLSFAYLLMVHIPLVITAALIPMLGYPLLYLPIHIVWLELIIHPTALLVFQNLATSDDLVSPPSRETRPQFFDPLQWSGILLVGLLVTAMVSGAYLHALGADHAVEHARTLALSTLVFAGAGITASLSRLASPAAWALVIAAPLASILLVVTPGLSTQLNLQALHPLDWSLALAGGLFAAVLVRAGRRWHCAGPAHR